MTSVPTYNLKGETKEKTTLPKQVFGVKPNPTLLAQAVRVYLGNQRAASAKTKTRGQVAKTTAKMYRQKGTGRARHGAASAPIFVGGGIAHGPDGRQNYTLRLPQKMRQSAICMALSAKASSGQIAALTGGEKSTGRTKQAKTVRTKIAAGHDSLLVVTPPQFTKLTRSWRNLDQVAVVSPYTLTAYSILSSDKILLCTEAITILSKLYAHPSH